MKRFLALAAFLIAASLHAQVKIPEQTETDKRLPPKVGNWSLREAVVKDASLPRVLLIGDSIASGYLEPVRKALEGKANIDAWITPISQGDKRLPAIVEDILKQHEYAVVHFNLGLHGWQKGRIPEGQFEPLTHAFVQGIKKGAPKAKLIWATITPVTVKGEPEKLNPEIQPTIDAHNAMALKVMKAPLAEDPEFVARFQTEARAAAAGGDAAARRLEVGAAGDQARRLDEIHQQTVAVERSTARAATQARSAHDAETPLDPDRAARLAGHDRELCRLAPVVCGAAAPDPSPGGDDALRAGTAAGVADPGGS